MFSDSLQLNGRRVRTPLFIDLVGAKVITSGSYSLLDTNFGLQVKFDGVHHLEIIVPGEYFNKVQTLKCSLVSQLLTFQCFLISVSSRCVACVETTIMMALMITLCPTINQLRMPLNWVTAGNQKATVILGQ